MSAADVLDGSEALDALFRQQLTDLLATRLLAPHAGSPTTFQPTLGGLSPRALRRAIERLHSDSDADVSLDALASDAGLSRLHFGRASKESSGLSPHAWLRQHRLEQATQMLRDTDASVVSVSVALGVASQTAVAAAFRRLTGETPGNWRRHTRNSNRSTSRSIALGQRHTWSARPHLQQASQQVEGQMMVWKTFVSQTLIASRSRVVATTFMYALSATVRFTTATGNETKILAQSVHRTNPMIFIMTRDGLPIFCNDRGPKSAQPIVFQSPGGFRTACARPMPIPARPHA